MYAKIKQVLNIEYLFHLVAVYTTAFFHRSKTIARYSRFSNKESAT